MIVLKLLAKTHKETIGDKTDSKSVPQNGHIFCDDLIQRLFPIRNVYHVTFYEMVLMFVNF